MTLEEWQIALRRQAAMNEHFGIAETRDNEETGSYTVRNASTHNIYKVICRGADSEWNYCSCMDFKSNRLGTCKHLEAVKLWLQNRHQGYSNRLPAYTSVFLHYREGRKVRIRIGEEKREDFERLAVRYFDSEGVLRDECVDNFSTFLSEAHRISNTFRCYDDVLQYIIDLRDKQRCARLAEEACSDKALDGVLRTRLYPFQKEAVRFAVKAGRCLIADEMGLGKTIEALATAEVLREAGFIASTLILCPTSLKYQWKKEIERFTDSTVLVVEGNRQQRLQQYEASEFYKIVSYNSVSNDIRMGGTMHADLLVMDEAQRLKNWKTQISMSARRIEADYTVVLSGTPLENKLLELYSIVQFVDQYRLGPLYRFVDLTTVLSDTGQVVGYKNLHVVCDMLKGVMLRRRRKDVELQLPERTDKELFVPLTGEQRAIHGELQTVAGQIVAKWHRSHFLSEHDRKRLLLALNEMRMVCDSTYILDQKSRHDTKIEELMNIIDDVIETGDDKIVVFSQWERMTRLVCQELDNKGIGYVNLNGSVASLKRKELMDEFTDNAMCRVFVSTDAGSTGLNLQAASFVINLDLPWNPAVLEQRISRIYRIGQKHNIQVINFVAEDSIEERMLATLDFKSNLAEGILDAGDDAVFLDTAKFDKLMNSVSDVVGDGEKKKESCSDDFEPPVVAAQQMVIDFTDDATQTVVEKDENSAPSVVQLPKEVKTVTEDADGLIKEGVSFLTRLSEMVSTPEKLDALLDSLVKVDPVTGKTKIEIPVPDRESVMRVLEMIGKWKGENTP
jgi:SNF2 family DNA or RNA helicase